MTRSTPASSAAELNTLARLEVAVDTSIGSNTGTTRPASSRATSRRLFTSFKSRRPLRSAMDSTARTSSGSLESAAESARGPSRSVSGVRNSWLMLVRKAVLARSISSSASALRSASSCPSALASPAPMAEATRLRKSR